MTTCCTGDCNQGRECPLRPRRSGWWRRLMAAVFCLSLTGCAPGVWNATLLVAQ
jgi:hypothetical protein